MLFVQNAVAFTDEIDLSLACHPVDVLRCQRSAKGSRYPSSVQLARQLTLGNETSRHDGREPCKRKAPEAPYNPGQAFDHIRGQVDWSTAI